MLEPSLVRQASQAASCAVGPYSLEATRPSFGEIADLAAAVPKGTAVYLSSVGAQTLDELTTTVMRLRDAGLEPVPHLAARRIAGRGALATFLRRAYAEGGVRRVLVVGGETSGHGPYADALALLRDGLLEAAGLEEIGIAGYPEGHPRIATDTLDQALRAKLAAACAAGLRPFIVTQFSFAPEAVAGWLRTLRVAGIAVPVKVGMAGPASIPALLRYAKRCGVGTSLRGLMSGAAAGLAAGLGAHVGPDRILTALDAARGDIGDVAPHYFSFGGVVETARYAQQKAAGAEMLTGS
ncbi:MAG: 5,10-methylenetetrahydrofolate reductase [Pseudolabrys sp.]|jgi:methylenetetrahydrofolate reductase (NADPH)|nr:5,10-methylenetetrahydrofolate reductase [Pseudolabrys sp.]